MKKNYLYSLAFLLVFVLAAGFIVVKYKHNAKNKDAGFYPLHDRKGISAQTGEWKQVQKQFDDLMKMAGTNPDDMKAKIRLAELYINEARITGDYMYYNKAAMKYVNDVLQKDASDFEALVLKSLLQLSQHHFAEGLVTAEQARVINPHNAFVYGILVDGNVEMGNYKAAVDHADKMVSIRPDIRSYARISYLREIHGDYPGAIEAMKLAVDAGPPGHEATEWTRVQLGQLYEATGDIEKAEMNYQLSLQYRPSYAYAMAGLGRIAMGTKKYAKAISFYLKADSLINDYSFKEQLVDLYRLTGQNSEADKLDQWLISAMKQENKTGIDDETAGHYADLELANMYIKRRDFSKALEHALAEYNRRPGNIDVNETVAWIYYERQELPKAISYLQTALQTRSNNPRLLCYAGLIYARAGEKEKAKLLLQKANTASFIIPQSLRAEMTEVLKTL